MGRFLFAGRSLFYIQEQACITRLVENSVRGIGVHGQDACAASIP